MKRTLTLLLSLCTSMAFCQPDSTLFVDKYLPRFYKDTGTLLPPMKMLDEQGKEKTLEEFRGKILYIDMWSITCGPCIGSFPYREQLYKRTKALELDTAILFLTIDAEDSWKKWKKGLKKYHPTGINLYSSDTSLYRRWNVQSLPCYMLIGRDGKVLGKDLVTPGDASIDWLLYAATKGITPVPALWRSHQQNTLSNNPSQRPSDPEYEAWRKRIKPLILEYLQWRKKYAGF